MQVARFFYKDIELAKSFYSQIFSGLLEEVIISSSSNNSTSKDVSGKASGGLDLPFVVKGEAEGELKHSDSEGIGKSKDEHVSPHDLILLDVIAKLRPSMKLALKDSSFSDLVYLKGKLFFIPKKLEEVCIDACLDAFLADHIRESKVANLPKNAKRAMEQFIRKSFQTAGLDPRFYFSSECGGVCTGFMKTNGLTDDQLSLFYKHGVNAIPAHMIAVNEESPDMSTISLSPDSMFETMRTLTAKTATLWTNGMPPSISVTPLAFFFPLRA